jgi:hypothetical protein
VIKKKVMAQTLLDSASCEKGANENSRIRMERPKTMEEINPP